MRTNRFSRTALTIILACAIGIVSAQITETDNNILSTTSYAGCDGLSNVPFKLMHNNNYAIEFWTDTTQRMELWNTRYGTINGFTNRNQNGFLGISNQPLFFQDFYNGAGPFSRLHLADSCNNNVNDYAQYYGYRPWMKNGVTFTGNKDQSYIGQKYAGTVAANDSSDVVIQWSDNEDDSQWPTDRLRFLFTTTHNSDPYGAHSTEGLESFRVFVPNDTAAHVGIGDFHRATVLNAGVMVDPTERLDVLDGRVRIRQLPSDPEASDSIKVLVIDTAAGPDYGVVKWKYANFFGGGSGGSCDWNMSGGNNDLATAWTGNPCPPQGLANVGIGGPVVPGTKLVVSENTPVTGVTDIGINVATEGDTENNLGLRASCNALSTVFSTANTGVYAEARNAKETNGVFAWAEINTTGLTPALVYGISTTSKATANVHSVYGQRTDALLRAQATSVAVGDYVTLKLDSSANTPYAIGVSGRCMGGTPVTVTNAMFGVNGFAQASGATVPTVYGVYGVGRGSPTAMGIYGWASNGTTANYSVYGDYQTGGTTNDFSGYFVGDIKANGVVLPSDDALKLNEEAIPDALSIIEQLQPKQYDYDVASFPAMHLPEGPQMGLIAQELESVLPGLVRDAYQPAETDSSGNVTAAAVQYKGINYIGLIPLLIGAVKEQQAQIAALQDQVSTCCAEGMAPQGEGINGIGYIDNTLAPAATDVRALRPDELVVTPNPFTENPTIRYLIGASGRAQLRVGDANGRDMGVLFDTGTQAGEHSMVWNTTAMAAGTYWLTLTLDGKRITEQAVKVE